MTIRFNLLITLAFLFSACAHYAVYVPVEFSVVSSSETAPGFELPEGPGPKVKIVEVENPSVLDQKINSAMERVVVAQGGILSDKDVDLIISVATKSYTDTSQEVVTYQSTGYAYSVPDFRWGEDNRGSDTNFRMNLPVVLDKKTNLTITVINIAAISPRYTRKPRQVWEGTIIVPTSEFRSRLQYWLDLLFAKFGGVDGTRVDQFLPKAVSDASAYCVRECYNIEHPIRVLHGRRGA